MPSPSEPLWFLRPGLLLPTPAILAVLNLERAGHLLTLDADGENIRIEPARGVQPDEHDLAELRKWKAHCLLFLAYTITDAEVLAATAPTEARL